MLEAFKVFIDRLQEGQTQKITGLFEPAFLEVEEKELKFCFPVQVDGEAYVADDHLVMHFSASTVGEMPCAICNQMIQHSLKTINFYQTESLSEISSGLYDFGTAVREALLLEIPRTVECNQGDCPERKTLTPYLRSESKEEAPHFPFSNIDKT